MKTVITLLLLLSTPALAEDKPLLPPNLYDLPQVGPKPDDFAQWHWRGERRYDKPSDLRWPAPVYKPSLTAEEYNAARDVFNKAIAREKR